MSIRSAQFSVQSNESSFSSYQVYDMVLRTREKQLLVAYDVSDCLRISHGAGGRRHLVYPEGRHAVFVVRTSQRGRLWSVHVCKISQQVHVLRLIEPQGLVLTGGSDGEVRIWRLPDASQLALWNPAAA
ncbi:WD domain, G-beta repeat-containing protein [Babesia caballi]|uniref:WD domain, G-beta repeat-containing protein n=1 Tax=Babesia caballi TaxID=5871 RepID=A0AAV4LUI3_BABCB|nr:WD domain, G-beta repeat-containing protein [Babesia caballi]